MAEERIGEQQKEIYENAMRTHKKRMGIVFLVLVCTYSFVFFWGQLIDKGGEWRDLLYLAGAIVVFLPTLLHPLTADSDLSAHIRKWKVACLLGPIIFAVGMFLLGTFITAGAHVSRPPRTKPMAPACSPAKMSHQVATSTLISKNIHHHNLARRPTSGHQLRGIARRDGDSLREGRGAARVLGPPGRC